VKRASYERRRRLTAPSFIASAFLAAVGCADDAAPPPTPIVNQCSDLRPWLAGGELRPGTRYEGENGFAFEPLAGPPSLADIDACEALESSAQALVASGVPGAVLSYRAPRFALALASGLSDTEAGTPFRADALVRVASLGKTYVGALATVLSTEGRLDLDNVDGRHALSDYLPETLGRIQYADRITLRQLLNHTSGIPDYFGEAIGPAWIAHLLDSHQRGVPVTEAEALELVYGAPADFEPGSAGNYCNTGYLLVGRVLDRVLGRSFMDEIHDRFLQPLALNDTYFEKHDSFDTSRLSHGYRDASPLGESFSDWFDVDQGYGFANGGVVSTMEEVAAFFRAVPGGRQLPSDIDALGFLQTMRPTDPDGYGLGLRRGNGCFYHNGTFAGYTSLAFHCEDRDVTGALFINSSLPEHDEALIALGSELMR
jgi:D-alanyl-D-alanine carboxypeptidase